MAQAKSYTAEDIQVLEGLEPVRKRPGMYIGGTGSGGYHHLLWEVVDNSIDEVINKSATKVEVTIHADGKSATVEDNGRGVPVDKEGHPPPMARVENTDIRRVRNYPMQPPTIPHTIDGYQVDKNSNRCMLCHARANAATFQAPPVSVTHYMDRDDQFLATISPRRYFCNQCHVVQTDAPTLVANGFKDIDSILAAPPPGGH